MHPHFGVDYFWVPWSGATGCGDLACKYESVGFITRVLLSVAANSKILDD